MDTNGKYTFSNIHAGTYFVSYTTHVGLYPITTNVALDDTLDSDLVGDIDNLWYCAEQDKNTINNGIKAPSVCKIVLANPAHKRF